MTSPKKTEKVVRNRELISGYGVNHDSGDGLARFDRDNLFVLRDAHRRSRLWLETRLFDFRSNKEWC